VCQSLYRSGDLDKTMILISSDHGMTNTKTHIDIARCLDQAGHRCLHYPLIWRRNVKSASMVSGNGMANLYFKANAVDWGERMPFEEIDRRGVVDFLLEFEGLGLIAGQSEDGSIIVRNRLGKGQVSAVNGTISYKFDGVDPLGYNTFYHNLSSREALIETYDTKYPDGLVQISQIFRSSRAGDLVLSAEPGYDLRARYEYPEHHATHGGLIAGQMLIPLAVNFPIETEFIRSVDIFPTVLNQFGHQVEGFEIDGQIVK
ncbi:MAG: alkaline phosphatase family protein, partial [Candidatus Poribacteria bacterium]|nr:alkaline phosphatase family protein [Candidatus Poribacteria bacterium]